MTCLSPWATLPWVRQAWAPVLTEAGGAGLPSPEAFSGPLRRWAGQGTGRNAPPSQGCPAPSDQAPHYPGARSPSHSQSPHSPHFGLSAMANPSRPEGLAPAAHCSFQTFRLSPPLPAVAPQLRCPWAVLAPRCLDTWVISVPTWAPLDLSSSPLPGWQGPPFAEAHARSPHPALPGRPPVPASPCARAAKGLAGSLSQLRVHGGGAHGAEQELRQLPSV